MESAGSDSDGRIFCNADEMWREYAGDAQTKGQWYDTGLAYWSNVEASVDGVLGGYGNVNNVDIRESEGFLLQVRPELRFPGKNHRHLIALDCGSGIGRVTKNLLLKYFNEVDLLEPVSHFLDAARESLAIQSPGSPAENKASNFFCMPLQDFTPATKRYDIMWIQWCIGYLTDDDFLQFFKRIKVGLRPGGLFIIKDNIAKNGFVLDKDDRSITRSDLYFKDLFTRCGLHLFKEKAQKGLPKELFSVKMYALSAHPVPKPLTRQSRKMSQSNWPAIII